jgi:integrase
MSTRARRQSRRTKGACAFFGNRPLAAIGRRDVEDYIATVRSRGVTRNTIRLALAPVRCMFRDALERGDITRDPTIGVRLGGRRPVRSDETKDVLTPDELGRVLVAIPEDHRLFVRFLTVTGTRIGEAVAVQWRDLRDGGIRIERRWYRGMLDEPKTEAGTRTIPLRPEFVKALKTHRLKSPHSRDTDFIFSSTEGGPLHASNFRRRILKPAFEAAGITLAPNLCFHVFRRSCGTWLGSHEGGNMDLPNLAAWLGHEDARVTLKHYLKPTGLEAPAALDALGKEPDVAHIVAHT